MCTPKSFTPMNCDVFCVKGNSPKLEDICITGNFFISQNAPVKGKNVYVEGDMVVENVPITFNKVEVKGKLLNYGRCNFNFNSLSIGDTCIIGTVNERSKRFQSPVNCDVFCIESHLPADICITGNLYIANNEKFPVPTTIDVGKDIYVDCARLRAYEIKSHNGSVYVYGNAIRAFMFDCFVAMNGCQIYSEEKMQ